MGFRKYLFVSAGLHLALLVATLIGFSAPRPQPSATAIDHIPIEFAEASDDPQSAGERDAQRQETPQRREVANPAREPDPVPVPPPERPRPVDPSSAPTPPPPPVERQAEPAPPAPTPPPPPQRQVAEATPPPPDEAGLLRRIEEDRRREERDRQQAEDRRRAEQQQQREAEQRREREQREARERQAAEQRRQAEQRRREEQQRRQQAQQQEFDAQRVRDIINRQQGTPQQQGVQGNQTRTASLGNPRGAGRSLTQSDTARLVGMIRDQISPCWSPPPAAGAAPPVVRIEIFMNRDGSLNGRPRIMNAGAGPNTRPFADSAVRAIVNCAQRQGGKLNLPAEMYDATNGWREIEFAFDPSQML